MKFKSLFLIVLSMIVSNNIFGQNDNANINTKRIIIVGSGLALGVGATYFYVNNAWWSNKKEPFHFDSGADLKYALNVDKMGHFMGGLQAADIFSSSIRWSGVSKKKSLIYGAIFGSGLQLAIEFKDAYAPHWGFSKWDLAIGTAGAFWPLAQYNNDFLSAFNFKLSYYKHSNSYFNLERQRGKAINKYGWYDDYPNQTYWLTIDINQFVETSNWPEWLNIAIGFGLDDTQYLNKNNTKKGGDNEWYIALDYDIPKILSRWDSPLARNIKHWLNYFHLPAPTIRVSPKLDFYPLFI